MQKRLVGFDMTVQQLSLLKTLAKREFMSPHEVAEWLHCDRPTASVIIKNLVKKELAYKEKDVSNAKYHRIFLSEAGKSYLDRINQSLPPLTVSPFDALSGEEREELARLLTKCCDRMEQIKGLHQGGSQHESGSGYDC